MEGLSLSVVARRFVVTKEAVRQDAQVRVTLRVQAVVEAEGEAHHLLDETKVKRNGRIAYVSVCLDLARREVVSARSYRSVGIITTMDTVKRAMELSRNRPIFIVDHAPWYPCAFEWLGVEWVPLTFNIRNYIERWYRTFKDKTKRFYNNFGIRVESRAIRRVGGFVHMFAYWYNRMRPHETLGGETPSSLS